MIYFISLSILFIFYELNVLFNPKKIINIKNQLEELKELTGEQKNKKSKELLGKSASLILINLLYFIWSIIGIFIYPHWYLFLFILFFGFFSSYISKQLRKIDSINLYYKIIDSLISLVILTLIFLSYINPKFYESIILYL
jgi:uncharacterized ion transporter superfamily protein YfcC